MNPALKARIDRGLTRREVAAAAGIGMETLRQIETVEDYHPRPRSLKKLGDYYGMRPSELRGRGTSDVIRLKPGDVVPEGVMGLIVKDDTR